MESFCVRSWQVPGTKASGSTLIATSVEGRVTGAVDLAHAALADEGGDVVMAEAVTDVQRHGLLYGCQPPAILRRTHPGCPRPDTRSGPLIAP